MATDSFVRVPPDSTGKRLFTQEHNLDGVPVQTPVYHLGCPNNTDYLQRVDQRGQAYTRFAEGSPTMDAFGNLRVANASILAGYEFTNDSMEDLFQKELVGTGSVTHEPTSSSTVFSVGTASGAKAQMTSNRYHYYQPGVGNLILLTIALGDSGKENNIRRWGYYDDDDGIFFELNGPDWNIVRRSSVTGSIVEERVGSMDWNGDSLGDTGIAGFMPDPTKANFYWLDFAWLGVGEIRAGMLNPKGERITLHIFKNPNAHTLPYMRTGSLPVRFENVNIGTTASTSEMRSICAAVYSESATNYTFWRFSDIERQPPVAVTTDTPILSMRVKAGSRVGIYPECMCVCVTGGPVKMTIIDDAELVGATWDIDGEGFAEGDIAATAITTGSRFKSFYINPGCTNLNIDSVYETNDEGYHRLADDSASYTFTLVATKLNPGDTVTVGAALSYKELR